MQANTMFLCQSCVSLVPRFCRWTQFVRSSSLSGRDIGTLVCKNNTRVTSQHRPGTGLCRRQRVPLHGRLCWSASEENLQQRHRLSPRSNQSSEHAPVNVVCQRSLHSTVDEEEIAKFRDLFDSWWDENGEFQALHSLNDLRVPLIRDGLVSHQGSQTLLSSQPLTDTVILDVGCGGGILSEPLARLGATVIAIDAASENIQVAQQHASHDPLLQRRLKYICGRAEDLLETEEGAFDAVVASEVLEHVSDVESLVATCSQLTKPGGSVFFTTINKTWFSYALAVIGAEDIARVVPYGTHDWNKFIAPEDLQRLLEANNCHLRLVHGMIFNPLTKRWSWGTPKACNYAIHAIKDEPVNPDTPEQKTP